MKKLLAIVGVLIIVALIIFNGKTKAIDKDNPVEVSLNIPEQSSVKNIIDILDENNLIKSKFVFKVKLKQTGQSSNLKAGNYTLTTGMNMNQIIDKLVEGPDKEVVKFTIPEGYEIRQIADRLSDLELVDREEFISLTNDKSNFEEKFDFLKQLNDGQGLEGFLYPATYEVFQNEGAESIINRMLSAFENIYNKEIKEYLAKNELDLNELITLSSIIEREGKLDRERPIMASVFYNRMEKNMKLQSCATVQYILGERKAVLSTKDTRTPSLYNTYLHYGLPPAPIASPGEVSILAAIYPDDTDYLFFVLTGEDGSHTFTKTFEEHRSHKK